MSRLCTNPLGDPPPPPRPMPNKVEKMVILGDHGIKIFSKTSNLEVSRVKNCISRLCTNLLGDPPPSAPNTEIRWKRHEYSLKHVLPTLDGHFR